MQLSRIGVLIGLVMVLPFKVAADGPISLTRDQRHDVLAAIHSARANLPPVGKVEGPDLSFAARRQVIDLRASFQEVPVGRGDQVRFARVLLSADGAGFDAIRFRTPATGEKWQLGCEIVCRATATGPTVRSWNILPIWGSGPGFAPDSVRRTNIEVPGAGLPRDNVAVTQELTDPIPAATESLIWFDLNTTDATPIDVKLRLTPVAAADPPQTFALQKARTTYEAALAQLERKYDAERATVGQTYSAALLKALRDPVGSSDPDERPRIAAELAEIRRGEAITPPHRGFRIIRAGYGADERWADVTRQIRNLVRGDALRLDTYVDQPKPDPAPGVQKSLLIIYSFDGNVFTSLTRENDQVQIPPAPATSDQLAPSP